MVCVGTGASAHATEASPKTFFGLHSQALGAPYLSYDAWSGTFDGVVPAIYRALEQETGLTYRVMERPRLRLDQALARDADIHCHSTPYWAGDTLAEAVVWTDPLYELVDVVFARADAALDPSSIDDLTGTISVVDGYQYPTLDHRRGSADLLFDGAPSEEAVVLKVAVGRTTYGVVNRPTLDWVERHTALPADLVALLQVHATPVRCRIRASGPHAETLHAAVDRLALAGTFRTLLEALSGD